MLHGFDAERGIYEDATYWDPSWTLARGAVMTSNVADILKSAEAIGNPARCYRRNFEVATRADNGQTQAVERNSAFTGSIFS